MLALSELGAALIVASTAPVLTFLLGFGVAETISKRSQRRKLQAETREQLATEMYQVAGRLYFELQDFWRKAHSVDYRHRRNEPSLERQVAELDDVYAQARRDGKVIEQRLLIYFESRKPAQQWHRVMDLLSVRYRLLLEADPAARSTYREKNSGPKHTGLTVEGLKDPSLVLSTYRSALPEAVASLWREDIDWEGRHIRTMSDVTTWSIALDEPAEEEQLSE